jgi:hypothetical protein
VWDEGGQPRDLPAGGLVLPATIDNAHRPAV